MPTAANYDPKKAHDYYERTKHLKGRGGGNQADIKKAGAARRLSGPGRIGHPTAIPRPSTSNSGAIQAAQARVTRLKAAVSKLESALSEARAALSKKRQSSRETAKKSSDGKSTAEEKQASKKYREKHQQEIATKRKHDSASGSGGSSSSSSSSGVSSLSATELQTRINKIQGALTEAKRQLSNATQQLGQLAHSAITSEPSFNEHFARFRSAERMDPSK